ncbi:hypothetical protein GCM10017688_35570 [Streptomyces ramulosus]
MGIPEDRYDTYVRVEAPAGGLYVAQSGPLVTGAVLAAAVGTARDFEERHLAVTGRSAVPGTAPAPGVRPAVRTGRARQLRIELAGAGLTDTESAVLGAVRSIPHGQLRPVSWVLREAGLHGPTAPTSGSREGEPQQSAPRSEALPHDESSRGESPHGDVPHEDLPRDALRSGAVRSGQAQRDEGQREERRHNEGRRGERPHGERPHGDGQHGDGHHGEPRRDARRGDLAQVAAALARNPAQLLIPCHRVTDDEGVPYDAAYGGAIGAALREAEGVSPERVRALVRTHTAFLGSDTTHIYCHPLCAHARRITPRHQVPFRSARDARRAGYRPCRSCRPLAA